MGCLDAGLAVTGWMTGLTVLRIFCQMFASCCNWCGYTAFPRLLMDPAACLTLDFTEPSAKDATVKGIKGAR